MNARFKKTQPRHSLAFSHFADKCCIQRTRRKKEERKKKNRKERKEKEKGEKKKGKTSVNQSATGGRLCIPDATTSYVLRISSTAHTEIPGKLQTAT